MNKSTQTALLTLLRVRLGTWPEQIDSSEWGEERVDIALRDQEPSLRALLSRIHGMRELFVGMANGPFLLVMTADDPQKFINFAEEHPTHNIHMTFVSTELKTRTNAVQTVIRPASSPDAYTLSFGLPESLQEHLLFDEQRGIRLAPGLKQKYFSEITIYRRSGQKDSIYRLTYEPQTARASRGELSGHSLQ